MNPGDQVLVRIPNPIPHPFNQFSPNWIDWAKLNNDITVSINYSSTMSNHVGPPIAGYYVKSPAPLKSGVVAWFPDCWLVSIAPVTCICDSQTLFNFGCQCDCQE